MIDRREREGIPILDLKGRLVLGSADSSLRQKILSLYESGTRSVIVNLRQVTDIDTGALGTLIFWANRFRDVGGKMVLLNVTPSHTRLSDVLKLNTVFESYQDEQDAVNSFFPDRAVQRYDILEFVEGREKQ